MREFEIAPSAFVSVGSTGEMGLGVVDEYPGNLLLSIGQYDEMITNEAAISVLRRATGNESAEPNITYGSFENQTAVRLAFAPTEHVFEAIDSTVVAESIEWFVQALQGESQLERTLNPTAHVYQLKVYAMAIGAFALLTSTIPLVLLLTTLLPDRMKPLPIQNDVKSLSIGKTMVTARQEPAQRPRRTRSRRPVLARASEAEPQTLPIVEQNPTQNADATLQQSQTEQQDPKEKATSRE